MIEVHVNINMEKTERSTKNIIVVKKMCASTVNRVSVQFQAQVCSTYTQFLTCSDAASLPRCQVLALMPYLLLDLRCHTEWFDISVYQVMKFMHWIHTV